MTGSGIGSDPAVGFLGPGVMAPVLCELERIARAVESAGSARDQERIADLEREVTQLRMAVAHLRAGAGQLPDRLRPVLARALLAEPGIASASAGFDLCHATNDAADRV